MTLLISGMQVLSWFLWFLLILAMFLLIAVILLQEGKGGGLAEAFGGVGAETFGVKAHGINKFTAVVGTVFLVICIVLTKMGSVGTSKKMEEKAPSSAPASAPHAPGQPNGGGNAPPPGNR